MKLPANIDHYRTATLKQAIAEHSHLGSYFLDVLAKGYKIYAVKQSRGRCYPEAKIITIPLWAIDSNKPNYWIWYVAHELSHALDDCLHNHGLEFMNILQRVCPDYCIAYEHEYKPLIAAQAGIQPRIQKDIEHVEVLDALKMLGF